MKNQVNDFLRERIARTEFNIDKANDNFNNDTYYLGMYDAWMELSDKLSELSENDSGSSMNGSKFQEIIEYLSDGSNYDKENLIKEISLECEEVREICPDELSISWDGKAVGDLENYNRQFYDKVISKVVNVIKSFEYEEGGTQ